MGKDKLSKVYVGTISKNATEEELRNFIFEHGINDNQITGIHLKRGFAFIDCLDQATADTLIDKLNGAEFLGQTLLVQPSVANPNGPNGALGQGLRGRIAALVENSSGQSESLKILIPSEYVGAVIGRGGNNIKDLTTTTGARINILRNRTQAQAAEKVVCIIGSPTKCSEACRRILEVCIEEAASTSSPTGIRSPSDALKEVKEVSLKILANNSLIGKIIGKDGRNIKKIMQDTGTKIHVSNQVQSESLETTFYGPIADVERVITVRGSIDGMAKAESLISAKLRAYPFELDPFTLRSLTVSPGLYPASFYAPNGVPLTLPAQWGQPLTKLQTYPALNATRRLTTCYKVNSRVH